MIESAKSTTGRITYFQWKRILFSVGAALIVTTCLNAITVKINSFQAGVSKGALCNYEAQVEQLPELQLEQALPAPGTVVGTPLTLVVKAAKVDILRREGL